MTRSNFRMSADLIADLLLPSKRVNVLAVEVEPGGNLRFHVEHDHHDIPAGEMMPRYRTVGPIVAVRHGEYSTATILDGFDEIKPGAVPSTAPAPQPNSPTPAPAPSTTQAPQPPETKEGGIGQAINVERRALDGYKP